MGVGNLVGAGVGAVKGAMNGGFSGALKGAANGLVGGGFGSAVAQGAQIFQGYQDMKNQDANLQDSRGRYDANQKLIQDQLNKSKTPGSGETGLQGFLSGQKGPTDYSAQQIDANGLGLPSAAGNKSFNSSQDALTQMVNRDASAQLGNAGTQLNDLATNGGKQDLGNLLGSLKTQQDANLNENLAQQQAGASGLGQLAGTASQFAQGRTRNRAMVDNNALNAGIQTTEMNKVNDRRLSAAGTLGGLNLQGYQNQAGAAGTLTQLGSAQSGVDQAAANTRLSAATANQGAGLQANAQNNQAGQAFGAQQIGGFSTLAGIQQGNRSQDAALIGLQVGQQAPQRQLGNPLVDAVTQAPILNNVFDRLKNRRPGQGPGFSPFSGFQASQLGQLGLRG